MHIVLGGTGHVGSAVAKALLARNEAVTIVSHDASKSRDWERRGARVAVANVRDVAALRDIFRGGRRLFLLNPPAAPSTDTASEERASLDAILAALDGSGLEKVVAESTYGAQPGDAIGDLGVLYEMEQALAAQPVPSTVLRAAYYMSNWDPSLASARDESRVPTFYPSGFALPMVAPDDLGAIAARLLTEPPGEVDRVEVRHAEGPRAYSPADVAAAFADALGKRVTAVEIPPTKWKDALKNLGFSEKAAESFASMTAATLKADLRVVAPLRGTTSLQEYVVALVHRDHT